MASMYYSTRYKKKTPFDSFFREASTHSFCLSLSFPITFHFIFFIPLPKHPIEASENDDQTRYLTHYLLYSRVLTDLPPLSEKAWG